MAPIRRYLRISKHSVLECRIYLDNPSDSRWLLNPRDPVLSRIFEAIRPLVLPKLREENERLWMRKKSKPVKDVISEGTNDSTVVFPQQLTDLVPQMNSKWPSSSVNPVPAILS